MLLSYGKDQKAGTFVYFGHMSIFFFINFPYPVLDTICPNSKWKSPLQKLSVERVNNSQIIAFRYSHTACINEDLLVLIGGVSFAHTPLGVTVINLSTGSCMNFSLPVSVDIDLSRRNLTYSSWIHGSLTLVSSLLTHFSWETPKRVVAKQCRPRSDTTEQCLITQV